MSTETVALSLPSADIVAQRATAVFDRPEIAGLEAVASAYDDITTAQQEIAASHAVAQAHALAKTIEAERKAALAPIDDLRQRVQAVAKAPLDRLAAVKARLQASIASYRGRERARLEREERAALAHAAEQQREAELVAELLEMEVPAPQPVLLPPAAPPRAPAGVQERLVWDYAVVQPDAVPRELCRPAPDLIRDWLAKNKAALEAQLRPSGDGVSEYVEFAGVRYTRERKIVSGRT